MKGTKVWVMCEEKSGAIVDFDARTGSHVYSTKEQAEKCRLVNEKVVRMRLVRDE